MAVAMFGNGRIDGDARYKCRKCLGCGRILSKQERYECRRWTCVVHCDAIIGAHYSTAIPAALLAVGAVTPVGAVALGLGVAIGV